MKTQGKQANEEWVNALQFLYWDGHKAFVRGRPTKELLNYTLKINMMYPEINIPERNVNNKFRAAEAAWILSGDNRVKKIKSYCKEYAKFSDDGIFLNGAYGPPIVDQLPYILHTLKEDIHSRRAVITIWRPKPDTRSKDIPCTVSLQWVVRGEFIYCIANMRSNDIWLGTVYDMYVFSMITQWICAELFNVCEIDILPGTLFLNAGSLHLYKDNWEAALKVIEAAPTHFTNLSKWKGDSVCDGFIDGNELIEWLWVQANK